MRCKMFCTPGTQVIEIHSFASHKLQTRPLTGIGILLLKNDHVCNQGILEQYVLNFLRINIQPGNIDGVVQTCNEEQTALFVEITKILSKDWLTIFSDDNFCWCIAPGTGAELNVGQGLPHLIG